MLQAYEEQHIVLRKYVALLRLLLRLLHEPLGTKHETQQGSQRVSQSSTRKFAANSSLQHENKP